MTTVFMICGSTGAGKTTHARRLAGEQGAILFSIDPWMQTLFARDIKGAIRYEWMIERVRRCESQIWQVVEQLIARDLPSVLDLGFFELEQRHAHRARAEALGATVALHFLDLPVERRRERVAQRNREKDPAVYALEVTPEMFEFMEPRFQAPTSEELVGGLRVTSQA